MATSLPFPLKGGDVMEDSSSESSESENEIISGWCREDEPRTGDATRGGAGETKATQAVEGLA